MSRLFDGTDDVVHFALPTGANVGFGTFAAILRCTSFAATRSWMRFWDGSFINTLGAFFDTAGRVGMSNAAAAPVGTSTLVAGEWYFVSVGKASGNQRPRVHFYRYSTDAWVHENTGANIVNANTPVGLSIGGRVADQFMPGDISIAGFWASELTDAQVERLPFDIKQWYSLTPTGLWLFDQADVSMSVPDLTGNGGNQSAITGTSVSTLSVPSFSYGRYPWVIAASDGASPQTLIASGISSLEQFGLQTISSGAVSLSPSAIDSVEAFGTNLLGLYLLPSSIESLGAFGSSVVSAGGVSIIVSGITSLESFGSQNISAGLVLVSPTSISSLEDFGGSELSLYLVAPSITSVEEFGTQLLTIHIAPTSINSIEAFGTHALGSIGTLIPSSIDSLEAFGLTTLTTGEVLISVSGISTLESFGDAIVTAGGLILAPSAIASLEAFGDSSVIVGSVEVLPNSITSAEAFGTSNIHLFVVSTGISSEEAFGTQLVEIGALIIDSNGIASVESFGTVTIEGGVPIVVALATAMVSLLQAEAVTNTLQAEATTVRASQATANIQRS